MRWNLLRLWRRLLAGASMGGLCWALACAPVLGQATSPSSGTTPSSSRQSSDDTTQDDDPTPTPSQSSSSKSRSQSEPSSSSKARSSRPFDQDSSDTTRSGRETSRDARDSTRDQLKETRDSARDATREDQEDQDDQRSSRQSAPSTARSSREGQRDSSRDQFEDIHGTARDSSRSARDSSRDPFDDRRDSSRDRDDARDDQRDSRSQRETARDQRDSYQRDDRSREFSRDDRGFGRDDREFSRDDSRDQRSDFRDSRDDFRSTSRASYSESRSSDVDFRAEDVRSADIGLWFNRSSRDGLVISDVSSSGAITRFGFREGDQILSVNGWRVDDESTFIEYLFDPELRTQRVEVIVWRGGRQVANHVQPSVLIQEYTSTSSQSDPLEEYGLVLDDRYPSNIVVWKVLPRTPAFYAGIRPGDTIVSWGGYRVSNPQQFTSYVQRGWSGPIDLQVNRSRQMRQLQLDMDQGARRTALRPNVRTDTRGNVDVDRLLPGREERIEGRIERRDDFRDGSYGVQGGYQLPGGTYGTQTYGTQGTVQGQPGVQVYGQGTYQQGQPGVRAGAEVRPGILPRARGR
jgi:hypothetical protein